MKYIIGIDEVGRGPLAGPVTVAAILKPKKIKLPPVPKGKKLKRVPLRDSKKLCAEQREIWFEWIQKNSCPRKSVSVPHESAFCYAVASVSPKIIDKINVSKAANLAATRALKKLLTQLTNQPINQLTILLDGGLYIKMSTQKLKNLSKAKLITFKTIVKGDEKIPAIALASIVAKVKRDKAMKILHKKYPQYGFDIHKGYGTKIHMQALKKHGPSKLHRKSFIKNLSQ